MNREERATKRFKRFALRNAGRKIVIAVWHTLEALNDERLQRGTVEFMAHCYFSARDGGKRECFGCCRPWTLQRGPVGIMVVESLGRKNRTGIGMLAGLCPDCAGNEAIVYAAIKRDFGNQPVPMPEAGHA